MRAARSETLVLVVVGALLLLVGLLSVQRQQASAEDWRSGSTYSSGKEGGRALYLWLDALGYPVERWQPHSFTLSDEQRVLWLVDAAQTITQEEASTLRAWIQAGGHLVWADGGLVPQSDLHDTFGIEREGAAPLAGLLQPVTPWITHADARYDTERRVALPPGALPLLADDEGTIGAFQLPVGAGKLWYLAGSEPLSNAGLHAEANSALVQGLLAQLPPNAPMSFDEFHHGFGRPADPWRLVDALRREPWGWGVVYGAAVGAAWVLLRGRAFGRPLPLPGEHLRREAGEFVRSMAWLYRRAGQRTPVLRHHHERLRRRVTQRYRLSATSDNATFVQALARQRPDVDSAALLAHLQALHQPRPTDAQLLALARANDEWLERLV